MQATKQTMIDQFRREARKWNVTFDERKIQRKRNPAFQTWGVDGERRGNPGRLCAYFSKDREIGAVIWCRS